MPFTKIEAKDYDGKGVTGLPDIPRLDTLDMQKKFDELAKDVAIPKHNVLVDELSGETAADNLGIADDIADFINPTKKIKPLLVTFAKKIKENSNDRHTHENKTVLDSITDTAIKAWNKVSNLFTNIDGVEDVVSGRTSKIPSSFAISQYVQRMGGGDMVQSIYDRNGNGIVDDAEALGGKAAGEYQTAESQELQTTSKSVVGAVNEVFNKTKDVLNTKEEIEGNTDPTAIAGALSVKELSNDLGGCSLEQENGNFYIVGADSARKKLGSNGIAYLGEMPYTCAKDYGECTLLTFCRQKSATQNVTIKNLNGSYNIRQIIPAHIGGVLCFLAIVDVTNLNSGATIDTDSSDTKRVFINADI